MGNTNSPSSAAAKPTVSSKRAETIFIIVVIYASISISPFYLPLLLLLTKSELILAFGSSLCGLPTASLLDSLIKNLCNDMTAQALNTEQAVHTVIIS